MISERIGFSLRDNLVEEALINGTLSKVQLRKHFGDPTLGTDRVSSPDTGPEASSRVQSIYCARGFGVETWNSRQGFRRHILVRAT